MTIKITIEVESDDEALHNDILRRIGDIGDVVRAQNVHRGVKINAEFTKEAKEVPEVQPGRWPRLRDIIVPSRAEADEIVGNLRYILRRWGYVTVADLLAEVGKSSESVDTTYGWTSLTALQYRGGRNSGPIHLWLPTPEPVPTRPRPYSEQAVNRRQQTIESIVLSSRSEAEEVLGVLRKMAETYGSVSVGDLYNTVGVSDTHANHKWGWTFLSAANSSIRLTDEGYEIVLPKPKLL